MAEEGHPVTRHPGPGWDRLNIDPTPAAKQGMTIEELMDTTSEQWRAKETRFMPGWWRWYRWHLQRHRRMSLVIPDDAFREWRKKATQ